MKVTVNGAARQVTAGATVAELLEQVSATTRGVAVAVDGSVVPRAEWMARVLREGDTVELLTAVQGG